MKYRREEPDEEDDYEWMYDFFQEKMGWTDEQMSDFNFLLGSEVEWEVIRKVWEISHRAQIEEERKAEEEYYRAMAEEEKE